MQHHYYHDTTDRPNADDYPELYGATLIEVWQTGKPDNYPYVLHSEGNSFLSVDVELGIDVGIGNDDERWFCFSYNQQRIDDTHPPVKTLPTANELEAILTDLING